MNSKNSLPSDCLSSDKRDLLPFDTRSLTDLHNHLLGWYDEWNKKVSSRKTNTFQVSRQTRLILVQTCQSSRMPVPHSNQFCSLGHRHWNHFPKDDNPYSRVMDCPQRELHRPRWLLAIFSRFFTVIFVILSWFTIISNKSNNVDSVMSVIFFFSPTGSNKNSANSAELLLTVINDHCTSIAGMYKDMFDKSLFW